MGHQGKRRVVWDEVPRRLWQPDGVPFGWVRRAINADPVTGGETLMVDIPPGWELPNAGWNESDLELLVVDGDLEIGGLSGSRGMYAHLPAGTDLELIRSREGAELIFWHDSPFRMRSDEAPAPLAPLSHVSDIFDEANWSTIKDAFAGVTDVSSHDDLKVPTRCIRLRKVEESGIDTILFVLPRGFQKTSLEFHHSTEEIFFLAGMCATDPDHVYLTGDYLCWEPGVIHGVVSGWDSLCLSKHHGPLTSPNIPLGATSVDISD